MAPIDWTKSGWTKTQPAFHYNAFKLRVNVNWNVFAIYRCVRCALLFSAPWIEYVVMDRKIADGNCTINTINQSEIACMRSCVYVCVCTLRSTDLRAIQMQSVYCLFVCGFVCAHLTFQIGLLLLTRMNCARSYPFKDKNQKKFDY